MFNKTHVKEYYGLLKDLRDEIHTIKDLVKRFDAYEKKLDLGEAEREQVNKFLDSLNEVRKKGKNLFGV